MAPVRVRRYEPEWYGFALTREPLSLPPTAYRAVSRGAGYWRYELAGEDLPSSWPDWADAVLGPRVARTSRCAHRVFRRREWALSRCQRRGRSAPSLLVRRDREVIAVANLARDVVWVEARRRRSPRDSCGPRAERRPRDRARRLLVLCSRPLHVAACDPRGRARVDRADRQGATRGHELRVVHSGAQRTSRRVGCARHGADVEPPLFAVFRRPAPSGAAPAVAERHKPPKLQLHLRLPLANLAESGHRDEDSRTSSRGRQEGAQQPAATT
jgi:hypothetical protein